MGKLPKFYDSNLLVGTETSDDAAVYRISDELAMIQTVDFFTPVVDDPYLFGQIAAANALSDIYAMGGEPKIALNIAAFPNCLDSKILEEILQGGASKVLEANAVLAGGHTIQDEEPKYGLCVTGFVHPEKIWKNYGAQEEDQLVLTKPLGSGILATAIKGELAQEQEISEAVSVMTTLNKYARDIAKEFRIHCCTDITGFGLAGHALEMAQGSEKTLQIQMECVPVLKGVEEYASMGLIPAGAYRNRQYMEKNVENKVKEPWMEDLAYDPQTSGGLLLCVHKDDVEQLIKALSVLELKSAVIGKVVKKQEQYLILE